MLRVIITLNEVSMDILIRFYDMYYMYKPLVLVKIMKEMMFDASCLFSLGGCGTGDASLFIGQQEWYDYYSKLKLQEQNSLGSLDGMCPGESWKEFRLFEIRI